MTTFEQINLTEDPDNPRGEATFDVVKVVQHGMDNEKILDALLKILQPLGKAIPSMIRPGTGVALVEVDGKMEIIAIRRIADEPQQAQP